MGIRLETNTLLDELIHFVGHTALKLHHLEIFNSLGKIASVVLYKYPDCGQLTSAVWAGL